MAKHSGKTREGHVSPVRIRNYGEYTKHLDPMLESSDEEGPEEVTFDESKASALRSRRNALETARRESDLLKEKRRERHQLFQAQKRARLLPDDVLGEIDIEPKHLHDANERRDNSGGESEEETNTKTEKENTTKLKVNYSARRAHARSPVNSQRQTAMEFIQSRLYSPQSGRTTMNDLLSLKNKMNKGAAVQFVKKNWGSEKFRSKLLNNNKRPLITHVSSAHNTLLVADRSPEAGGCTHNCNSSPTYSSHSQLLLGVATTVIQCEPKEAAIYKPVTPPSVDIRTEEDDIMDPPAPPRVLDVNDACVVGVAMGVTIEQEASQTDDVQLSKMEKDRHEDACVDVVSPQNTENMTEHFELRLESSDEEAPEEVTFEESKASALRSRRNALETAKRESELLKEKRRKRHELFQTQKKIRLLPADVLEEIDVPPVQPKPLKDDVRSDNQKDDKEKSDGSEGSEDEEKTEAETEQDDPSFKVNYSARRVRDEASVNSQQQAAMDFIQSRLYGPGSGRTTMNKLLSLENKRSKDKGAAVQFLKKKWNKKKTLTKVKKTGIKR